MKKTLFLSLLAAFGVVGCSHHARAVKTNTEEPRAVKTYNEDTTRTISQDPVIGQPVDAQKPGR